MPRKNIGKFRWTDGGVSIRRLNKIAEAVERLDTLTGGHNNASGTINSLKDTPPTTLCMVRMTESVGPDESSEFRDRRGVLQWYDSEQYKWKDTYPEVYIDIVTMPYGHFPVPVNTKVVCWYHRQAGKYVILNNPQVLHVRTVDPAEGDYPTAASKTYPVAFVITEYENEVDVQELDVDEIMDDDVERLTPSPPHGGKDFTATEEGEISTEDTKYGYVFNLGDGYIPLGTTIHAWFYCGQLYTYFHGGGGVIGRTKTGGITAMEGSTWPYQLGRGTVDIATIQGDVDKELVDSGEEMTVYNSTRSIIPADVIVQIKYVNGVAFVDVEDCEDGT